jgi:phage shock protein C
MLLTEELNHLHDLHRAGALSDEEFTRAKARLLADASSPRSDSPHQPLAALNALRRSRSDRWIAGVCGGIAAATGMEPWLTRLLFSVLLLFGGAGFLLYLLLWLFVPNE